MDVAEVILLSLILISNIAIAQIPKTESVIAGNLDLNISSGTENAAPGKLINISIKITNSINQERSFEIKHTFNNIIARPIKDLKIERDDKNDTDNNGHTISSNFKDNNNYISSFLKNGDFIIKGSIKGMTNIIVNYNTSIKKEAANGSYSICPKINESNFKYEHPDDFSSLRPNRSVDTVSIANYTNWSGIAKTNICADLALDINIEHKYNITDYNEKNITIFEGTKLKISISGNKENLSNILFYDIHDGMKSTQSISTPNSYEVCRGDHSFSAEIYPKQPICNNSTTFHAISLMQHHKSLVWDKGIYLSIIAMLALIIPYGLHRKFGKDNKYIISFVVLTLIIAYIWSIRDYLSNDMMYKDIIVFGYISLFAGLYLLMYVYHNGMDGLLVAFQAICMIALVIYYNYYMDFVLSKTCILFIVPFSILIISIVLNIAYKTSKGFQSMIAVILVVAGLFSAPFISIINSGIPFSSRFELHHITIIILIELIPLMVIGIAGRESVKVLQFIKDKLKLSSSSENSEVENNAK